MNQKITLKRAVAVTATRGPDPMGTYTVAARAVEGNVLGADDDKVSLLVHTAYVFERDGTVSTHYVGGFKQTLQQCIDAAARRANDGDPIRPLEVGRVMVWKLDNREPTKMTIARSNIDGTETLEAVGPAS